MSVKVTTLFPPPTRASSLTDSELQYLFSLQRRCPLNIVDTTAGNVTIALPNPGLDNSQTGQSAQNQELIYIKGSADANTVTITGAISGTVTLTAQFQVARFKSDAVAWWEACCGTSGGGGGSGSGLYFFGPGLTDTALILGTGTIGSGVSAGQSAGVVAANVVTVYKFTLAIGMTISKVTTQCTDNLGGSSTFGIYDATGSKVVDGGAFPNVSAAIVTNNITPVTLSAGVYWHAQAATLGNNPHFPGFVVSNASIISGNIVPFLAQNSVKNGTAANPLVAGVLPATLGVITPFTPTFGNGDGVCCPLYE